MSLLLDTAGNMSSQVDSRVHCLNILRALFRDSKLGELVGIYVETGVIVAIDGFKSANWAERNAATLLFSALMTRIFGVKREKDSLSSKNCLTGKIFFSRYPALYQYLLDQLSSAGDQVTNARDQVPGVPGVLVLDTAIYPVLLILSRLYPSPTETLGGNPYQLSSFLDHVTRSTSSAILQTRQLAASALGHPSLHYIVICLFVFWQSNPTQMLLT